MSRVGTPTGYDRSFGFVSRYGREFTDLLAPVPDERVLDLGCGTGELAAALAGLGIEVHGIDADAAMIAQARAKHPEIRFEQADGHKLRCCGFCRCGPVERGPALDARYCGGDRPGSRRRCGPGGRLAAGFGRQGNVAMIRSAVREVAAAAGVDPARLHSPWFFPSPAEYATLIEAGGFRVRRLEPFDRLTALDDCPNGIVDWLRMFGLNCSPVSKRPARTGSCTMRPSVLDPLSSAMAVGQSADGLRTARCFVAARCRHRR